MFILLFFCSPPRHSPRAVFPCLLFCRPSCPLRLSSIGITQSFFLTLFLALSSRSHCTPLAVSFFCLGLISLLLFSYITPSLSLFPFYSSFDLYFPRFLPVASLFTRHAPFFHFKLLRRSEISEQCCSLEASK